ncbi:MAG: glycosyltransferase family 39 protein [Planctomycetaceae bacterium]|jgi:4-amino-4-deoxy-L-arabinose transferase-like glycosyltransferase|nr:glycosyltransferase family 39 protein [Planctomycetaceae bacterium]
MLPAWILEILNILTCRAFAAPFIASQLCTLLALWSVWKLGRTVLDERLALIGVFSVLPYRFFTTVSISYNHNNVLIAFWCWSIYLVFQAFQTNKKRYWISAGIALGLAFHAKYSAVFLVLSILAYMFTKKKERQYFRTPGPYLTTLIAFLIFLPHIFWLFSHDFAPLAYAQNPLTTILTHWYQRVLLPFNFAASQVVLLIPTIIIVIPVIGFVWHWKPQHREQGQARECEQFLFYCFMIPLVCHMLYSAVGGVYIRTTYGAPFWVFGGLWLLLRSQETKETLHRFRRVVLLMSAIQLILITRFFVTFYLGQQYYYEYLPMHRLGVTCDQLWQKHASGNCPYIATIGSGNQPGELARCAACAMQVRPSVILWSGYWADDDDLNQKGGLLVWERTSDENVLPEKLRQRFPKAELLPEAPELPYKAGVKNRILKLGIAIVPPP